jgi:hypothetical protein
MRKASQLENGESGCVGVLSKVPFCIYVIKPKVSLHESSGLVAYLVMH